MRCDQSMALNNRFLLVAIFSLAASAIAFAQVSDEVDPKPPESSYNQKLNDQRIELELKKQEAWKNGNVSLALTTAEKLIEVERQQFDSGDDRLSQTYAELSHYALELDRVDTANRFLTRAIENLQSGRQEGNWRIKEAQELTAMTNALMERPLEDRQELFYWQRQLQQSIDSGALEEALTASENFARVCRELFGERHTQSILAMAYVQAIQIQRGYLQTVGTQLERLRVELTQVAHPQHPSHGILQFLLGQFTDARGDDISSALNYAENSIDCFQAAEMTESLDYARSLTLKGGLLVKLSRYEEALMPLQDAYHLSKFEGQTSEQLRYLADNLNYALRQVAHAQWELKNWSQAQALMKEAYELAIVHWGKDNFRAIDIRIDPIMTVQARLWTPEQTSQYEKTKALAREIDTLISGGDAQKALEAAKLRYQLLVDLMGRTNAQTLRARLQVIKLILSLANTAGEDLERLKSQILDLERVYKENFGQGHWEYGLLCLDLADPLPVSDEMKLDLCRKAVESFRISLSSSSDEYAQAVSVLGCLLDSQDQPESEQILKEAISLWEASRYRGNYAHLQALCTLGMYYYNAGDPYEARQILTQATDLLRDTQTENVSYDLAQVLNFLGNVSADQGRLEDALVFYQEALKLFETGSTNSKSPRYGKSIQDYISTYEWCLYNAASSFVLTGKYAQADELLKKLLDRLGNQTAFDRYRNALYIQAKSQAHQNQLERAQQILQKAKVSIDQHEPQDPLILGHFYLISGEVYATAGDLMRSRQEVDLAFQEFRKIEDLNEIEELEWGYFDTYLLRLREAYEALQAWDQVVQVREFARQSEEILYDQWPQTQLTLKRELQLSKRVAALDPQQQSVYAQMRNDTKTLEKGSVSDQELGDILERSDRLMAEVGEHLGYFNLASMEYARQLALVFEQKEVYEQARRLMLFSITCGTTQLGYDHSEMIALFLDGARIQRLSGNYTQARKLAEQCVTLSDQNNGQTSYNSFQSRLELAQLYAIIDDFAHALPLARAATQGFKRIWGEENLEYAQALQLLGEIQFRLGQPELGYASIEQSHQILSRILPADNLQRLKSSGAIAVAAALESSDNQTARTLFVDVFKQFETAGQTQSKEYRELLLSFGDALMRWGDPIAAEQAYLDAGKDFRGASANAVFWQSLSSRLGIAQRKNGKLHEATQNLNHALEIQQSLYGESSSLVAHTKFQIAVVSAMLGDRESARKNVLESLDLQQAKLSQIGSLMTDESLKTILSGEEQPLDLLIELMLQEKPDDSHTQTAFQWLFQRKGLALDLSCRMKSWELAQSFDTKTLDLIESIRLLSQELADLSLQAQETMSIEEKAAQSQQIRELLDQQQGELALKLENSENLFPKLSINQLVQKLPPDSCLIDYFKVRQLATSNSVPAAKSRYVAFLARNIDDRLVVDFADLGDAEVIEQTISELREQTRQVPRLLRSAYEADLEKSYQQIAAQLYRQLLEPFQEQISTTQMLIIGPDEEISNVPFAALCDLQGHYLVESHQTSYVSSARDLLRKNGPSGVGTIVVADPNFDANVNFLAEGQNGISNPQSFSNLVTLRGADDIDLRSSLHWKRLPGAQQEAAEVSGVLTDSHFGPVTVFLGDQAVEEIVKSTHAARIVHLATHGFYVPLTSEYSTPLELSSSSTLNTNLTRLRSEENPLLRSGIVLAGANRVVSQSEQRNKEDGWLTAQEIARMDFRNTELIVLSACESGLGDLSSGQGVQGIRRAFINAGAHSVLTSLFKVPDLETRELITGFYQELLRTGNRREALCVSQKAFIDKRRQEHGAAHPFFWASFILIGDAQ